MLRGVSGSLSGEESAAGDVGIFRGVIRSASGTVALARETRTDVLPARAAAMIFPCMAIVATAAMVLALSRCQLHN